MLLNNKFRANEIKRNTYKVCLAFVFRVGDCGEMGMQEGACTAYLQCLKLPGSPPVPVVRESVDAVEVV